MFYKFAGEIVHVKDISNRERPYTYNFLLNIPAAVIISDVEGFEKPIFHMLFKGKSVKGFVNGYKNTERYYVIESDDGIKFVIEKRPDLCEEAFANYVDYVDYIDQKREEEYLNTLVNSLINTIISERNKGEEK